MGSSLHFLNIINNKKKMFIFFSGYFCIKKYSSGRRTAVMQCGILLKLQSTVTQLSWSIVSKEISQWNNRLVMLVHQSYLSLC